MNLLEYEFVSGPDDSVNGMLRKLVTDLRYNSTMLTIDEFRVALPSLQKIEQQIQHLDRKIGQPHRDYIDEIMQELKSESENEINIEVDLRSATTLIVHSVLGQVIDFDELSYSINKEGNYHWLSFLGYKDERPTDACILITRETFRAICNKYNYIFIDMS